LKEKSGSFLVTAFSNLYSSQSMSEKYPGPVQLHSDFNVDLTREGEFLAAFEEFKRIVGKAAGFRETRLLKIRPADQHEHASEERWKKLPGGAHPAQIGPNIEALKYRVIQEWDSEAARWAWNPTEDHNKAWHPLEQPLLRASSDYMKGYIFTAYLFDVKG